MNSTAANLVASISGGYSVQLRCSYFLEELLEWDPDDEMYSSVKYLRTLIMEAPSMVGAVRPWLDENKWHDCLQNHQNWPGFESLLRALEDYDITLSSAILESCVHESDLGAEEAKLLFEFLDKDDEYSGIDGRIKASLNLK